MIKVFVLFVSIVLAGPVVAGEYDDLKEIQKLNRQIDSINRLIVKKEARIIGNEFFYNWVLELIDEGRIPDRSEHYRKKHEKRIDKLEAKIASLELDVGLLEIKILKLMPILPDPAETGEYTPMDHPWKFTTDFLFSNPQDLYQLSLPDGNIVHTLTKEIFPVVINPDEDFILTVEFDTIDPVTSFGPPSPLLPKDGSSVLISGGQTENITDPFGFVVSGVPNSGFEIFLAQDGRIFYVLSDPERDLPMSYFGAVNTPIKAGTHMLKVIRASGMVSTVFDDELQFGGETFNWAKTMTISTIGSRPEGLESTNSLRHEPGIHSVDLILDTTTVLHFDFNAVRDDRDNRTKYEKSRDGDGDYYSPIEQMPDVILDK